MKNKVSLLLLKLPFSLLVKGKPVPAEPISELNIDINKPIVYALPFDSSIDLISLQKQTKLLELPDPTSPLIIGKDSKPFKRYVFTTSTGFASTNKEIPPKSVELFTHLLELHQVDPLLDVQLIPVSILWGRKPDKEKREKPYLQSMNMWQKGRSMLFSGRDCLVRFSPVVSLRHMADVHGVDESVALKLARVARIHFSRQKLAASGPSLPQRQTLFDRLLDSPDVINAINTEAKSSGTSSDKVQKQARAILEEIAANFSYTTVKNGAKFLGWLWNKLYQGLNINNMSTVRKLAQEGHEIIYAPCHRSHMDYLLLSYVLHNEGMVPPHIAAGVNLNFFPAGPIFRRGGAFFIRRSFKGNALYSTIFKEYLSELFRKGYSVEFFSEGGRSRTGRLLTAKTGMLSMTVQSMMKGLNRPVTIVPVYIGYEHVMEVATYAKELAGSRKEKENASMVIRTIRKLKNFGQCYVNFGEPININQFLNEHAPNWSEKDDSLAHSHSKPKWMNPAINKLATQMMTNINSAVATNALTLCATALLATGQKALSRQRLEDQLECYLQLLSNVPYSATSTAPTDDAKKLILQAEQLNKFEVSYHKKGDIISLNRQQAIHMTYYRNSIIHVFTLPSLIAHLVIRKQTLSREEVQHDIKLIYPFLKAELFLQYDDAELVEIIDKSITELVRQNLLIEAEGQLTICPANVQVLILLARTIIETLQRYTIALAILIATPTLSKTLLEKESQAIAERLAHLHGISAPEFFDKGVFISFFQTLKSLGYVDLITPEDNKADPIALIAPTGLNKTQKLANLLDSLMSTEVLLTINESLSEKENL